MQSKGIGNEMCGPSVLSSMKTTSMDTKPCHTARTVIYAIMMETQTCVTDQTVDIALFVIDIPVTNN